MTGYQAVAEARSAPCRLGPDTWPDHDLADLNRRDSPSGPSWIDRRGPAAAHVAPSVWPLAKRSWLGADRGLKNGRDGLAPLGRNRESSNRS
jgi:hypothetical protein